MKFRSKLMFLLWYEWVDISLPENVRQLFGWRKDIVELNRQIFEEKYLSLIAESRPYATSENNYRDLSYKGLNLWEICKSSICDALRRTKPRFPEDSETIGTHFAQAERYLQAFQLMVNQERPDAIVVEQGLQLDMRAAVEVARREGVRTVAIENSFLKDYFFMDDSTGAITNRHSLSRITWDRVRARALADIQRAQLDQFVATSTTTFKHREKSSRESLETEFGLPGNKSLVLLIGQVATDASIVMDSPVFEDQVEFMAMVVEAMEKYSDEFHLVIRLHPKESFGTTHLGIDFDNVTLKRLQELKIDQKTHVTIFHSDQVNTYELMEYAKFGLTINSQAGFEMLLKRKPMIIAGDAFYARKGFTKDVSQPCQLACTIDDAISSDGLTAEQYRDIQNFAYSLFFESLFPKNLDSCETRMKNFFR